MKRSDFDNQILRNTFPIDFYYHFSKITSGLRPLWLSPWRTRCWFEYKNCLIAPIVLLLKKEYIYAKANKNNRKSK